MSIRFVLALFSIVTIASAVACADDSKLDKTATDILKQASDLLKNAKSLHVDTKITFTVDDKQGKRVTRSEGSCDLAQPDHFAYRVQRKNEDGAVSAVCDGKSLFTSAKVLKQYSESPAPEDLSRIGLALTVLGLNNTGMVLVNVLSDDPYEQLMSGVNTATYAGKEKVGDMDAHHLKFTQDAFSWEIWIAAEGKPLVLRMHANGARQDGNSFEVEDTCNNWRFDERPAKDAFSFSPAKDAKKVQNLDGNVDKK